MPFPRPRSWSLVLLFAVLSVAVLSCKRAPREPRDQPLVPNVRFYIASTVAGAMEPCGCRKDMLGGVDHAAQLIAQSKAEAPHALVLASGPLFFLNPELTAEKRQQDLWKAQGIAAAMRDIGLAAWAPGVNDFAAGPAELSNLTEATGARLLAANLRAEGVPTQALSVVDVGGLPVGLVGVSSLANAGLPVGVVAEDPARSLREARDQLRERGAKLLVALVAAQRGEALRLAESVPGYHLMLVGKPFDRGEGNDAPTPAVVIGETLVVQAPNHLQSLSIVDLFVRDGRMTFEDGSGVELQERRTSLERNVRELSNRLQVWKERGGVEARDVSAREADLMRMQAELDQLAKPRGAPDGSFFRYDLRDVREDLGSDERVLARMRSYYKQVNEHNRQAFADRRPPVAALGEAVYLGGEACAECHQEADVFWKTTGHAKAYETLVVDFKEFNLDCVSCHVTGYERPGGSTVTFVDKLKDVQCEECHGAGSIHAEREDTASITLTPAKNLCAKCHHPPHVADDWSVDEAWKHIIGPGHGQPVGSPAPPPLGGVGGAHPG